MPELPIFSVLYMVAEVE